MWLSQFVLGRPGYEIAFDINPNQADIKMSRIAADNRVLSGRAKSWVFRTSRPIITLSSGWFTVADFNAMQSLLAITDTMLAFKLRDGDLQNIGELCYPTGGVTVPIRENSQVLLSSVYVAAGLASTIVINGVYDNPGLTGTNYYTGGSYTDGSYTINLGMPLATLAPVYVTYSYPGYLVRMSEIGATFLGGQVDLGKYSGFQLEGC